MKFLKILLGIVIALLAIFFIGAMFLPKTYSVSRSAMIKAADTTVYSNIADFRNFLKWNPWYKMEPSAKINISGTPLQPGHLYEWNGKETGQGQMKIKEVNPATMVSIELRFIKPFESTADTRFDLAPAADSTRVTWSMAGENKSAMEKWMGLCMDGMIGKDFESGLKNLKQLSEKQ